MLGTKERKGNKTKVYLFYLYCLIKSKCIQHIGLHGPFIHKMLKTNGRNLKTSIVFHRTFIIISTLWKASDRDKFIHRMKKILYTYNFLYLIPKNKIKRVKKVLRNFME